MNVRRTVLLLALLLPWGCKHDPASVGAASREDQFWTWFVAEQERIFRFENDQAQVFADLGDALRRVHKDLVFEFGPVRDGRREFTISAGGMRRSFPVVERLVAAAPELPRWQVVAFRQRKPSLDATINGMSADQLSFVAEADGDRTGLTIYVKGAPIDDEVKQTVFLFLDAALGEVDVETRIGFIEVLPLPATPAPPPTPAPRPLRDLTALIDSRQP